MNQKSFQFSSLLKLRNIYDIIDKGNGQQKNTENNEELLEHEDVQTEAEKCKIRSLLIAGTRERIAKQSWNFLAAHILDIMLCFQ